MKKLNAINQLKWMGFTIPTASLFTVGLVYSAEKLGADFPPQLLEAAPILGATAALGWWTFHQFGELTPARQQNIITAELSRATRPIRLNGKTVFMRTVELLSTKTIKYKEPPPRPMGEFEWYVPYRQQVKKIRVTESRLYSYAAQGWRRQTGGDSYPFSRVKFYGDNWSPKMEACCYALLATCFCFDTWGQGAHSKLVTFPNRAVAACKRRYALAPVEFDLIH